MGNGFELRIGMTTQQVMSNINNMNATDKTKQLIINFCNNDHDKKITNKIELAMLDSWSKGSEKVKMPTAKDITKVDENTARNKGFSIIIGNESTKAKLYQVNNNEIFGVIKDNYNHDVYSSHKHSYMDEMRDANVDGYADERKLFSSTYINDNKYIETEYIDENLDGTFDKVVTRNFQYNPKTLELTETETEKSL